MEFKREILVIDDDRSVCEMIARTLEDRGYEVFTETHYKEGVERARDSAALPRYTHREMSFPQVKRVPPVAACRQAGGRGSGIIL